MLRALKRLGLDRPFLEKRLGVPVEDDERVAWHALSLVSHLYSVRPEEILEPDPVDVAAGLQPVAFKKPKRSREIRAAALAGYARYLSQLVAQATPPMPNTLPPDPLERGSRVTVHE